MSIDQSTRKMTIEDKELFVSAAQVGLAMGCEHRYEWFVNYQRVLSSLVPYEELLRAEIRVRQAFAAFERATCSEPGDPVETLTDDQYDEMVDRWYARERSGHDICRADAKRQYELGLAHGQRAATTAP